MVRSLNDAYLDLRNDLRIAGISGYQVEARELICYALDIPREQFYEKRGVLVFEREEQKIERLLKQRLSGTPVQYITGQWEFYGLSLDVSRDTLIPRADTELLAETAIKALSDRSRGRILDLCCGTGCVGIAVLKNVSESISGVFADSSSAAMHVARKNIMRHFLSSRAYTVNIDALSAAPGNMGRFNYIVCNPPYVKTGDIPFLDKEVLQEPRQALDGGEDGLDFYRAIPQNFKSVLAPNGTIAFEVGAGQSADVMEILYKCGYRDISASNDLSGIERVVTGTLKDF